MNKKSMWLGIAAVTVVIGAAIFVMGYWINGNSGFYIDASGVHSYGDETRTVKQLDLPEFENVQLKTNSCEVVFVESDRYRVEYNLPESYQVEQLEVMDGTLRLEVNSKPRLAVFNFSVFSEKNQDLIKVYYPSGAGFDVLDLNIGSGNLSGQNLQAVSTKIGIGSGECRLTGLTGDSVKLNITSGNADFTGLKLSEMEVKLSSGTLALADASIQKETAFSITSGGASLTKVETGSLSAELSSGDIKLEDSRADTLQGHITSGSLKGTGVTIGGIDYKLSSGDFKLEGLIQGATKIRTVSGSVKINTSLSEQECGYSLSALSGSTRVNGSELSGAVRMDAKNTFELSASSGDVDLNFAD